MERKKGQCGFRKCRHNLSDFALNFTSLTPSVLGQWALGQVTGRGLCMGTATPCSGHAISPTIRVRYLKLWLQTELICIPKGGWVGRPPPSITLYRIRMQHKAGEWRDIAKLGSAALVPVPIDVHPLWCPVEGFRIIPFGNTLFPFQNVKSRGWYLKWLKSPTSVGFQVFPPWPNSESSATFPESALKI